MIVVYDIRDLLIEMRREYNEILNQNNINRINKDYFNLHYSDRDFMEFSTWTIRKYLFSIRCNVQDFDKDHFLFNAISNTVMSQLLYGYRATLYDAVKSMLENMSINFIPDPIYLYSVMLAQNNLVIGRTNLLHL
jgi:hypothetical protein